MRLHMKKKSLAKKVLEELTIPPVEPGEKIFITTDLNGSTKVIQDAIDRIRLKHFGTAELCLATVQASGMALRFVPEELKTLEICQAAVRNNLLAFLFVPEALITAEFCLAAIQGYRMNVKAGALRV
jgi:hypothetical protein